MTPKLELQGFSKYNQELILNSDFTAKPVVQVDVTVNPVENVDIRSEIYILNDAKVKRIFEGTMRDMFSNVASGGKFGGVDDRENFLTLPVLKEIEINLDSVIRTVFELITDLRLNQPINEYTLHDP